MGRKTPAFERMRAKTVVDPSTGCHLWTGTLAGVGYGSIRGDDQTKIYVHRLAYEHAFGPIPDGYQIHHRCRTKRCVNPTHLEAIKPGEHLKRHYRAGDRPRPNAEKTNCPKGHPYNEENTYVYDGKRRCRACMRARFHRWYRSDGARSYYGQKAEAR